jgi:NAD(P)-dependent dehydrogenase (short-subunit alcohol dehydrogenase family)
MISKQHSIAVRWREGQVDRLKGKKALVIGGSTGIGAAICRRFAEEGAAVAVGSPDDERARADLVAELSGLGYQVRSLAVDVRVEGDVAHAVAQTIGTFGQIDILVNNAGVSAARHYALWEETLEDYERIMAINVRGVWFGMKHVLPHMLSRGSGRIINTASQLAHKPSPHNASYCASKAAVVALTVSVAQEVAERGITVNALCPGPTDTPMWAGGSREWKQWKVNSLPMKRVGAPDDQAWACVYMASDEAGYLTGQSISPNGGDVMW